MRMFSHTVILKSAAKIGAFFRLCAQTTGFFAVFVNSLTYIMKFPVYGVSALEYLKGKLLDNR